MAGSAATSSSVLQAASKTKTGHITRGNETAGRPTDGLAKLEAIKAKVDPQGLFQCQKCVGFKGPVRDQ